MDGEPANQSVVPDGKDNILPAPVKDDATKPQQNTSNPDPNSSVAIKSKDTTSREVATRLEPSPPLDNKTSPSPPPPAEDSQQQPSAAIPATTVPLEEDDTAVQLLLAIKAKTAAEEAAAKKAEEVQTRGRERRRKAPKQTTPKKTAGGRGRKGKRDSNEEHAEEYYDDDSDFKVEEATGKRRSQRRAAKTARLAAALADGSFSDPQDGDIKEEDDVKPSKGRSKPAKRAKQTSNEEQHPVFEAGLNSQDMLPHPPPAWPAPGAIPGTEIPLPPGYPPHLPPPMYHPAAIPIPGAAVPYYPIPPIPSAALPQPLPQALPTAAAGAEPPPPPQQQGVKSSKAEHKSELILLCERFQQKFCHLKPDGSPRKLLLNDVAEQLGVPRRRLYDVINVLESIEVMRRIGKLMYEFRGYEHLPGLFTQLAEDEEAGRPVEDRIKKAQPAVIPAVPAGEGSVSHQSGKQSSKEGAAAAEAMDEDNPDNFPEKDNPNGKGGHDGNNNNQQQPKAGAATHSHSLWVLSRRLVRMLIKSTAPITLTSAAATLVGPEGSEDPDRQRSQSQITVERRLYDIGSILCTLGLVKRIYLKKRQPAFTWVYGWRPGDSHPPPQLSVAAAAATGQQKAAGVQDHNHHSNKQRNGNATAALPPGSAAAVVPSSVAPAAAIPEPYTAAATAYGSVPIAQGGYLPPPSAAFYGMYGTAMMPQPPVNVLPPQYLGGAPQAAAAAQYAQQPPSYMFSNGMHPPMAAYYPPPPGAPHTTLPPPAAAMGYNHHPMMPAATTIMGPQGPVLIDPNAAPGMWYPPMSIMNTAVTSPEVMYGHPGMMAYGGANPMMMGNHYPPHNNMMHQQQQQQQQQLHMQSSSATSQGPPGGHNLQETAESRSECNAGNSSGSDGGDEEEQQVQGAEDDDMEGGEDATNKK